MSLGRGRGGGAARKYSNLYTHIIVGFLIYKKVIKVYLLIIVFALTPEIYI